MRVKVLKRSTLRCDCGCGRRHRLLRLELHEEGWWQYALALLARDGGERHLWFALGGATPASGRRPEGYASVETWSDGEQVTSRITDASESPLRHDPLFESAARLLDRAAVFPKVAKRRWVFETIDALIAHRPELLRFLASAKPASRHRRQHR
jgi:hypothetical protein